MSQATKHRLTWVGGGTAIPIADARTIFCRLRGKAVQMSVLAELSLSQGAMRESAMRPRPTRDRSGAVFVIPAIKAVCLKAVRFMHSAAYAVLPFRVVSTRLAGNTIAYPRNVLYRPDSCRSLMRERWFTAGQARGTTGHNLSSIGIQRTASCLFESFKSLLPL